MTISDDEARALAFIAALIGLSALGRWVDRPKAVLPAAAEVDVAALTVRSETAVARASAGRRTATGRSPSPRMPRVLTVSPPFGPGKAGERPRAGGGDQPLDLNRATAAELERLPGVGPARPARIVARRDSAGGFRSLAQLDSVRGVGPALLARLKPLLMLPR
ncbi:MAG: helix-hairpin-helix domain-containing protein [Gemmatimonadetes bacterium]|nr:helix-hairpin-helix domain-containing protein [Gemmatimonadota bacterium]